MKNFNIKAITIATAMSFMANASMAQEDGETIVPSSANPVVIAAQDVCTAFAARRLTLSDTAQVNCSSGAFPKLLKDGSRFSKRGTGSEFNTLISNMVYFVDAT